MAALIGVIALGLYPVHPEANSLLAAVLIAASTFLYIARILDPRSGVASLLSAFVFLFIIAIPAAVQINAGRFPFSGRATAAEITAGLVITAFAYLVFLLGLHLGARPRDRYKIVQGAESRPTGKDGADPRPMMRAVYATIAISAAALVYAGPANALSPRFARLGSEGLTSQLLQVGRQASLFAALLLIAVWLRSPEMRSTHRFRGAVVAGVPLLVVLNWPPALPRFQMFGAIIAIGVMVAPSFGTRLKGLLGLAAPVALFSVFSLSKSLGNAEDGAHYHRAHTIGDDLTYYLMSADFDAFFWIINHWTYYRAHGPLGLQSLYGTALFWVPRDVWPTKPIGTGLVVAEGLGFPFINVSSPLPAEGLMIAGIPGLIGIMVAFGYLIGRVERPVRTDPGQTDRRIPYALLSGMIVIVMRGSLVAVASMLGFGFIFYGLYCLTRRLVKSANRGTDSLFSSTDVGRPKVVSMGAVR